MANSNNAYGFAKPLEGDVSDWVTGQELAGFKQRAEKREIDKIAQERKDKEQYDYEKRLEKFKRPDIAPTGVKSIDEINTLVLLKAQDEYLKIYKEIKPGMSNERYAELLMKQKNLENLPTYLKLSQEAFVNEATGIQKQVAEGKIKFTTDLQKKLNSFSQGFYDVELDDSGMPMVGLWDKDGDGKPDILPYDKIVGQQIFGEQVPNMNFATEFQKMGEKLGSVENTTDKNSIKTTIKETPIDFARKTAKASLYDDTGGLTPVAKSKLYDMGYTDFKNVPDKALDQLEADAVSIMLSTRDKIRKVDVDNSAINTANENARKAAKEDKDKPTWGVVETPPVYKESGINPASGYKTIAVQGKTVLPALRYGEGKETKTITNGQIQSYTVKKNKLGIRQIVAEIVYQDTKGVRAKEPKSNQDSTKETNDLSRLISGSSESTTYGEQKKTKIVPLTEKDAKIFAIQLGFKSVNEMKDAARSGKKESPSSNNDPLGLGL